MAAPAPISITADQRRGEIGATRHVLCCVCALHAAVVGARGASAAGCLAAAIRAHSVCTPGRRAAAASCSCAAPRSLTLLADTWTMPQGATVPEAETGALHGLRVAWAPFLGGALGVQSRGPAGTGCSIRALADA